MTRLLTLAMLLAACAPASAPPLRGSAPNRSIDFGPPDEPPPEEPDEPDEPDDGLSLEDCTSGADEDGDGLVDCADPECSVADACDPDETARTVFSLEASLEARYYEDTDGLWLDTGMVIGVYRRRDQEFNGVWTTRCESTWQITGWHEREHDCDCAVTWWFDTMEPLGDDCGLGEEDLPDGFGLDPSGEAWVLRAEWQQWTLEGSVDWGGYTSELDYDLLADVVLRSPSDG